MREDILNERSAYLVVFEDGESAENVYKSDAEVLYEDWDNAVDKLYRSL